MSAHPESKSATFVKAYIDILDQNKDVIYSPGKDSIFGEPTPAIAGFWAELNSKVDQLFGS